MYQLDDMINSSWDIGSGGLKLVILDHFLSLYSLKNQKNQNFEKMKKNLGDIIIFLMSTKNHKYMMYGSWDTEGDKQIFFSFWAIFSLFTPLIKNLKKCLEIFFFTHVHHKWRLHDVWFLKYKARQAEFFVILPHFLPFHCPLTTRKTKILKNWRNFTHVHYKWQSYGVWYLKYGARRTKFFFILGHFLLFYPTNNDQNHIFEKMKKAPGDIIILQMCTTDNNYMMYGSWDMESDRRNFADRRLHDSV